MQLELRAGAGALRHIREHGLQADDITLVAGAAGGAKWLVLKRLDEVIFGHWLAQRKRRLPLIGSSIGAWRFCAAILGMDAMQRFYQAYLQQCYSPNPGRAEITRVARDILDDLLGEDAIDKVLTHPLLQINIMSARARGPWADERPNILMPSLVAAAALNALSSQSLKLGFVRHLFHHPDCDTSVATRRGWKVEGTPLSSTNLKRVMLASAAIPLVIESVRDIPGAPAGTYRDGGVTDYHMPLDFPAHGGIVLFPHFSADFKPGWFDKHLPWRRLHPSTLDNVLQIYPSPRFISRLPYGKIPDRRDFATLDLEQRLRYWNRVHEETRRLSDALRQWLQDDCPAEHIRPIARSG